MRTSVFFFLAGCFFFGTAFLQARQWDSVNEAGFAGERFDIRENREIRERLRELVTAPTKEVLAFKRKVFRLTGSAGNVAVEVKRSEDAYYVLFLNGENKAFPLAGRGNWIIKRDLATGAFVQVKIFYQSDPGTFLRIFPLGERSFMDVYLFDRPVYREVPVGLDFKDLLTEEFGEIIERTKRTVDWSGLVRKVDPSSYSAVISMIEAIRKNLSRLPDAEDGAMDKDGKLVYIASLASQEKLPGFNCSGFAKWVADGLYRPKTGSFLDIEELKTRQENVRGNFLTKKYEIERDPYFGLDWSRNIAAALARLDAPAGSVGAETQDVRGLPHWPYREDLGYPVEDLKPILYYLALNEPGRFYLGSISREFGRNPVLLQHVHLGVFFPYFDTGGNFRVAVMERNVESGPDAILRRYDGSFIHLVRIRASSDFVPPSIE